MDLFWKLIRPPSHGLACSDVAMKRIYYTVSEEPKMIYMYKDLTCKEEYQQPGAQDTCRDQRCLHSSFCSSSEEKIERRETRN